MTRHLYCRYPFFTSFGGLVGMRAETRATVVATRRRAREDANAAAADAAAAQRASPPPLAAANAAMLHKTELTLGTFGARVYGRPAACALEQNADQQQQQRRHPLAPTEEGTVTTVAAAPSAPGAQGPRAPPPRRSVSTARSKPRNISTPRRSESSDAIAPVVPRRAGRGSLLATVAALTSQAAAAAADVASGSATT